MKIITIIVCSIIFLISSVGQSAPTQIEIKKGVAQTIGSVQHSSVLLNAKEESNSGIKPISQLNSLAVQNKDLITEQITDKELAVLQDNFNKAKLKEGKEYFNNGKLKVAVNINKIELYFEFYKTADTLCWMDLLQSWQMESISDLYLSYINYNVNTTSLAEVNLYLTDKYIKRQDSINIQYMNNNFITNVEFEEP